MLQKFQDYDYDYKVYATQSLMQQNANAVEDCSEGTSSIGAEAQHLHIPTGSRTQRPPTQLTLDWNTELVSAMCHQKMPLPPCYFSSLQYN